VPAADISIDICRRHPVLPPAAELQKTSCTSLLLTGFGQRDRQTDRRTDGQCTVTQTHALTARSGQRNVATHTFFSVVDVVDVFPKELFRSLASRVVVVVVVGGLVVAQLRVRVVVEHNAAHKVTGAHLDVLREQQVGVRVVRLEAHLRHSLLQTSADEPVTYR